MMRVLFYMKKSGEAQLWACLNAAKSGEARASVPHRLRCDAYAYTIYSVYRSRIGTVAGIHTKKWGEHWGAIQFVVGRLTEHPFHTV